MKKKYLLVFIIFISAFFIFTDFEKVSAAPRTCEYKISGTSVDGITYLNVPKFTLKLTIDGNKATNIEMDVGDNYLIKDKNNKYRYRYGVSDGISTNVYDFSNLEEIPTALDGVSCPEIVWYYEGERANVNKPSTAYGTMNRQIAYWYYKETKDKCDSHPLSGNNTYNYCTKAESGTTTENKTCTPNIKGYTALKYTFTESVNNPGTVLVTVRRSDGKTDKVPGGKTAFNSIYLSSQEIKNYGVSKFEKNDLIARVNLNEHFRYIESNGSYYVAPYGDIYEEVRKMVGSGWATGNDFTQPAEPMIHIIIDKDLAKELASNDSCSNTTLYAHLNLYQHRRANYGEDYAKVSSYATITLSKNKTWKENDWFTFRGLYDFFYEESVFKPGQITGCDMLGNGELIKWLTSSYNLLKVGLLILVVVLSGIDAMKVFGSSDEKNSKNFYKHLVNRLICLAILFLVPSVIKLLLGIFGTGNVDDPFCGIL